MKRPNLTSADIRPSASHTWEACPGQPLLVRAARRRAEALATAKGLEGDALEKFCRDFDSSEDAQRGTCRHADIASALTGKPVQEFLDRDYTDYMEPDEDEQETVEAAVEDIRFFAEIGGYEIRIEEEFTIPFRRSQFVMRCHVDALLVNSESLVVIDYKNGRQAVSPESNSQLQLYAIAARRAFPGRGVSVAIIQSNAVRGGRPTEGIRPVPISEAEFERLEGHFAAAVNRCFSPVPQFNLGPWCLPFCPGLRGYCPAQLQRMLEVTVGLEAGEAECPDPWWMLDVAENTQAVLKKVSDHADKTLMAGGQVPGWTLAEFFGRRRWLDKDEAGPALAELLGVDESETVVTKRNPIGIGKAEKMSKREGVDISGLIDQPQRWKRVRDDGGFGSVE